MTRVVVGRDTIKQESPKKLFFYFLCYNFPMTKAEQLQQLHEKFHNNCLCALKNNATQPVFGNGNPESKIVFIGEAPGKKEDETGTPFVGAAGKFLNEMLESIKMKREDIYITNIVKYRPPNNRDPEQTEKEQCTDWLRAELEFIQPKLIIFLGRHSMSHWFPDLKIGEVHGEYIHHEFPNFPVHDFLPLYHPAAALYNGGMREKLMTDFAKIPGILKKLEK